MVLGYHIILTAYGWWLPNDPRGSTSKAIACDVIAELGQLHQGRKTVQPIGQVLRAFYADAGAVLKHDLLTFSPDDVARLAEAFDAAMARYRYTCYACTVMPDHVHLLIRKHRDSAEAMMQKLQADSRAWLVATGRRGPDHPVWCSGGWVVYQDCPYDFERTIRYIVDNPTRMRRPRQNWPFVTLYDGWPVHPGHNPNSPYARAIRRTVG